MPRHLSAARATKKLSRASPFVGFFSATFLLCRKFLKMTENIHFSFPGYGILLDREVYFLEVCVKKIVFISVFFLFFSGAIFSQIVNNITIEIGNIIVNGGKVYVYIYSNAEEFRNRSSSFALEYNDTNETLSQTITIPNGEYLIWLYQDTNNNGKYDTDLFGMPKEPFGFSNYYGQGRPASDAWEHRIQINNSTRKVTVILINRM